MSDSGLMSSSTTAARYRLGTEEHRRWVIDQADRLWSFYRASADRAAGGFGPLDRDGRLVDSPKPSYLTSRMTYGYSLAVLAGRPDGELVEHGLAALRELFRDPEYGGWYGLISADGTEILDAAKPTYGHAFVLLAAATAKLAGSAADDLIEEVSQLFDRYLFRESDQLCVESFDRRWSHTEDYRGVNANMHTVEAFLALHTVSGQTRWLARAGAIADRVVGFAQANTWRIPEHFDVDWRPLPEYNADDPADQFRPYGATPGHALEWARLLLQIGAAAGDPSGARLAAAQALFARAVADAWRPAAYGFAYTTDWTGAELVDLRLHWPLTEAIGAARSLFAATGRDEYADWYSRFWELADRAFIDHEHGGWRHELDTDGRISERIWTGKGDLYHALQACLLASVPDNHSLAGQLAAHGLD